MTADTKLAIYLRKKELAELEEKEAHHWNEYTHVQREIRLLENEIRKLEENLNE